MDQERRSAAVMIVAAISAVKQPSGRQVRPEPKSLNTAFTVGVRVRMITPSSGDMMAA